MKTQNPMKKSAPQPDRLALEIAYKKLNTSMSYEAVLKHKRFKRALIRLATKHMVARSKFDHLKARANDND
jgi:hypothetical protein